MPYLATIDRAVTICICEQSWFIATVLSHQHPHTQTHTFICSLLQSNSQQMLYCPGTKTYYPQGASQQEKRGGKKTLTWYVPMPMCLGSIFTSSANGSWTRLPMDTVNAHRGGKH